MPSRKLELKVFDSLQEADADDVAFYSAMSPRDRLNLVLELSVRHQEDADEAVEGRSRFYRVVELDLRWATHGLTATLSQQDAAALVNVALLFRSVVRGDLLDVR